MLLRVLAVTMPAATCGVERESKVIFACNVSPAADSIFPVTVVIICLFLRWESTFQNRSPLLDRGRILTSALDTSSVEDLPTRVTFHPLLGERAGVRGKGALAISSVFTWNLVLGQPIL